MEPLFLPLSIYRKYLDLSEGGILAFPNERSDSDFVHEQLLAEAIAARLSGCLYGVGVLLQLPPVVWTLSPYGHGHCLGACYGSHNRSQARPTVRRSNFNRVLGGLWAFLSLKRAAPMSHFQKF